MVDKFLGTGGGYIDDNGQGQAKATRANQQGRQEVVNTPTRRLFDPGGLNGGEIVETEILNGEGFTFAHFNFIVTNNRRVEVSIQFYRDQDEPLGYEVIYESDGTSPMHHVEYQLRAERYSLRIRNLSDGGGYLSIYNSEIRFVSLIPNIQKVNIVNTRKFKEVDIPF